MTNFNQNKTKKVFAGIYKDKGVPNEEADFLILYGDNLCLIYDGITDIFSDVEYVDNINRYELLEGYALGVKEATIEEPAKWQIRDSGRKNQKDYILAEGTIGSKNFIETLKPFFKVMS